MISKVERRPLSVTLIGLAYLAAGAAGLLYHFREFAPWVMTVRAAAVVCGVFLLRGKNWARCLAVAWMAYHVVLGFYHSPVQAAVHAVFLALIIWGLYRAPAARYFR